MSASGHKQTSAGDRVRSAFRVAHRQSNVELHGFELTSRELDVLTLLAEGASNKTIAKQLGISVHTAEFHVSSLLDKLDATGRTDAVAHAARRGVVNL